MSRILHTYANRYELDIRDSLVRSDTSGQCVWIVKIEDETGYTITTARVSCSTDEKVHEVANEWLNALCRANSGKLLRYVIQQYIHRIV